jgi:hypothetical protein
MPWRAQVKISWTNLKNLYDQLTIDMANVIRDKDAVIAGKDLTIKLLKEQLASVKTNQYLFAAGVFLAGFGSGAAVGYGAHK